MTLPWLPEPVMLHSGRDPGPCSMTPEQCAYKSRYWVNWYQADLRYGLATVALFVVTVLVFAVANMLALYAPGRLRKNAVWLRVIAMGRALSYRSWRVVGWNSQSLGVYLLGAVGFIFFTAMTLGPKAYYWPNTADISFGNSPPIATRTGYMALGCLPFILILGTKANPITALTGISHEKLNVWHNWAAWAMFVLALIHTFPFIVYHMWQGDIVMQWKMGGTWVTGVIAIIAQAWLTIMSVRWIRDRYYEFFKATHYLFAAVFVVFFFIHCGYILTSWDYFIAGGVLYSLCWLYAQLKTYLEHGVRLRARLALVGDRTLRVLIDTNAQWLPGQHVYLRFLTCGVHALTAHPFTVCSVPQSDQGGSSSMVFYVQTRGGLTGRLAKLAARDPNITVPVLLDGPFGGLTSRWFDGFDRALVLGGGAGAGFTLALVEQFVMAGQGRQGGGEMDVVIATRDPDTRRWYLEALEEIALRHTSEEQQTRQTCIHVHIHETYNQQPPVAASNSAIEVDEKKPTSPAAAPSPSLTPKAQGVFDVTVIQGRPSVQSCAEKLTTQDGMSVGLVVCGPASMVHDLGQAAAAAQQGILRGGKGAREVWFHKENFS